ncbi:bifunctional 4-hydroxy-3-methylbut-2-enyl diphosphate reductase/30S ribosomal protein S1 [Clostridium cadaveris]|uniref:bifunctional 4-hydroxy-3-methylbut-2-enyl diphosphate reductase/30S ribosomal protein S1 n=1 Tax=Clostridium cadaveris TaxID=1529 RepID=UPI0015B5D786|nr:bifunctional 4-hydroxy-3-methylbut-2-enyl diphosphate reductase/30S ribosomal protein S1 [Clostridium cadaveris]NWK10333.1 bifunctional 4-hydroxy-3-methylbut-2-enyl diphosphate reductase/30S ribosomal protein S1 [Clostridium cadaveris]
MNKQVILASNAGFCFGVKRAVDEALEVKEQHPGITVYTLGPLIHNSHAVNFLKDKNIEPIELENIETLKPNDFIIIRSHGIPKDIYEYLKEKKLNIIDATCPFVTKIQKKAEEYYKRGYKIIIVGDGNHPEVIGINGWCNNSSIFYKNGEFSEELTNKVCVLSQTTEKQENFEKAIEYVSKHCKEFVAFNTICSATNERQTSATELSSKVDAMIVLGGKNSSNTTKLYEICLNNCISTIHVESAQDIPESFLNGEKFKKIGITAGASTPDWIIKEAINKMNNENVMDMNDVMNYMDENERKIYVGQKINGVIVSINNEGVYVDINYKVEGIIPTAEISIAEVNSFKMGDEIEAKVIQRVNENGNVVLSRIEVEKEVSLSELKAHFENKENINVTIKEEIKGGLITTYKGINLFLPASLVDLYHVDKLSDYIGKELEVSIIEFVEGKRENKMVVSRKAILVKEKEEVEAKAWENFELDETYEGTVKRITNFGAFVEVNGVDGLLHLSEMSWGKIDNPKSILKINEKINVKIIALDKENKKLSLSVKALLENPWNDICDKYPEGNIALGKVVRFASFGAFIELEPGVDGLVHLSEISHKRIEKADEMLSIGENVKVKILKVDKENKKISLSIKATE